GSLGPVLVAGFSCFGLAGKLLGNLANADERQAVLRSLPYNPTTEMDLALWSIAQKIAVDQQAAAIMLESSVEQLLAAYRQQSLPPIVQQNLAEFLQDY